MALSLLAVTLVGLSFVTGALQARMLQRAWQLAAYDTQGTRRFALTLTLGERPDVAFFDAKGHRYIPGL